MNPHTKRNMSHTLDVSVDGWNMFDQVEGPPCAFYGAHGRFSL